MKRPIDRERALELYAQGLSSYSIAKELGCSDAPIRKIVRLAGLSRTMSEAAKLKTKHRRDVRVSEFGYEHIRVNGKRVFLHRVMAENILGRPLLPSEVIHHKNHDKRDNRPENLEIMTRSEHMRLHGKLRGGINHKRQVERTASSELAKLWV